MFGLFNEIARPAAGGGGGATFDPTTLPLTAYFKMFGTAPWAGTASAGTSGSRTLSAVSGSDPVAGDALNGINAATFDKDAGTPQYLRDATDLLDVYLSSTAYTVSVLIKPVTAPSAGANPYNNASVFGENQGNFGLEYSDAGIELFHYSGSYKTVAVALPTGSWALVDAKYDGTDIKIRVNGGAWTSLAAGSLTIAGSSQVRVGRNFSTVYLDASIMELLVSDTEISDADLDSYRTDYVDPTYGLAL